MDPDQTAPVGVVCSGSTMIASMLICSLDIFRCSFFAGVLRLNNVFCVYIEIMTQDGILTFE